MKKQLTPAPEVGQTWMKDDTGKKFIIESVEECPHYTIYNCRYLKIEKPFSGRFGLGSTWFDEGLGYSFIKS